MRMIPLKFTRRNVGEEKVFLRLSESFLGKKYTALHSIYLAEHIRQHCGEIDFILITNLAVIVLEVKATISFNPTTGIWNYGSYENDKSPLQQAEDNMQSLRKFLMNENQFLTKKFPFVSLVVVTEDRWLEDQKNIQIENNKIIDKFKLSYLEETILSSVTKEKETLFDKYKIKFDKSISHNDVEFMIKLILPNIALQSPEISDSKADLLLVEKIKEFI